jgi:hypothetical protein
MLRHAQPGDETSDDLRIFVAAYLNHVLKDALILLGLKSTVAAKLAAKAFKSI